MSGDGISVEVNVDRLNAALRKFVDQHLPEAGAAAVRELALVAAEEVASRVPQDSGEYAGGWSDAVELLASDSDGETERASVVTVEDSSGISVTVTNKAPHGYWVENGTESTPPGSHVALAVEKTTRRLVYGRGENSVGARLSRAMQDALEEG